MFRPRVIPILLLKNQGLVKSIKFKNYRYIGDPLNAVKLFNDLKVDELVFLDILASQEHRSISIDFIRNVADEANMPFAVGGGINTLKTIELIIKHGAEKVIVNSHAVLHPEFIKQASNEYGSSTIAVSLDFQRRRFRGDQVVTHGASRKSSVDPVEIAKIMEAMGAGELIINSVDRDGTMDGYDLNLLKLISSNVSIPVVAAGGAGKLVDFKLAADSYASAVAAGSLFVYHGPRKAVLINYPEQEKLNTLFSEGGDI
jgi:imidazole glycerol-phosphate synthase subunit HisF